MHPKDHPTVYYGLPVNQSVIRAGATELAKPATTCSLGVMCGDGSARDRPWQPTHKTFQAPSHGFGVVTAGSVAAAPAAATCAAAVGDQEGDDDCGNYYSCDEQPNLDVAVM